MTQDQEVTVFGPRGLVFLTFADGTPKLDAPVQGLLKDGLLQKDVSARLQAIAAEYFRNRETQIAYTHGTPFPGGGRIGYHVSKFCDGWGHAAEISNTPQTAASWREELSCYAPHLLRLAGSLKSHESPALRAARCILDQPHIHGGVIGVFLPMTASSQDCDAALELITALGEITEQGPPSQHSRITALQSLIWRHIPDDLPASFIPGRSTPL